MVLPDEIKELLRRDLPKKPIGELLQDLQRDLPEALDDFLASDNPERQKWIESKLVSGTEERELNEIEESDSNSEDTSELPELHWLTNILRYKPASSEEHQNWAKQIEAGVFAQEQLDNQMNLLDTKYKKDLEKIVEIGKSSYELFKLHNLRLVWSIARKSPQILATEEHFQNGIPGLIRAIEGWDWRQGFQFSTYASWWVRQSIYRALSDTAYTIRIPVHMLDKINSESRDKDSPKFEDSVLQENDPNEDDESPTSLVKNSLSDPMIMAKNAIHRNYSYELIADKYDFLLEYQVDPFEDTTFDYAHYSSFIYQLNLVLGTLSSREEVVIRSRFGLMDGQPKTLDEIGEVYGVTRERIRQIESKTMSKLRHQSRSESLKDFLDSNLW